MLVVTLKSSIIPCFKSPNRVTFKDSMCIEIKWERACCNTLYYFSVIIIESHWTQSKRYAIETPPGTMVSNVHTSPAQLTILAPPIHAGTTTWPQSRGTWGVQPSWYTVALPHPPMRRWVFSLNIHNENLTIIILNAIFFVNLIVPNCKV